MFAAITRRLIGNANDRELRRLQPLVNKINTLEPTLQQYSDDQLRGKTAEFKAKIAQGATLDSLLPEAFAVVREASKRTLGLRHFDVQLLGGIVLHQGRIAEMKTGEGKTLVATLPVYLNALTGKGVHVVTVNDYLAARDAEWMGTIYRFLGLTVGCVTDKLQDAERREAYAADITYGINNQFGFDYLRDNMKFRMVDIVQRPFNYAIVDEVDSILIDEARTPLIISGPTEDSSDLYLRVNRLMAKITESDYEKDEKQRSLTLTESGNEKIESLLRADNLLGGGSLYDVGNIALVHHVNKALLAHFMYKRDVDYIVKDGRVMIIDEFTGRILEGRRYGDSLHQAIEAKENVKIQMENQTLASITFQNYFRLYPKLAGMTGTAATEAAEFGEIYKLDVVAINTNVPVARRDMDDEIYRTRAEKYTAIIALVKDCVKRGQPVLVGTVSIEKSEELSDYLKKEKIKHNVLNARYHAQEAMIIAQAGRPGAVTIATNMAGRGTDIQLGGNETMRLKEELTDVTDETTKQNITARVRQEIARDRELVKQAGGLFVIGTERHESRRIDNQLRGRSGRQGDPGASKFYLSMEDDLLRIFGSERIEGTLQKLGLKNNEAIVHPWISKAIEKAQQRVEARHFDIRKNILRFDDVMNDQRREIYELRRLIMSNTDVQAFVDDIKTEVVDALIAQYIPLESYPAQWDMAGLHEECRRLFALDLPFTDWQKEDGIVDTGIKERLLNNLNERLQSKTERYGADVMRKLEKGLLLQTLDQQWKDHLLMMDHLRQGINLRAYAQKDPLNEYKQEAFVMFQNMVRRLKETMFSLLTRVELHSEEDLQKLTNRRPQRMVESRVDPASTAPSAMAAAAQGAPVVTRMRKVEIDPNDPNTWGRIARNDACPCGSGKKYKHCHGKI